MCVAPACVDEQVQPIERSVLLKKRRTILGLSASAWIRPFFASLHDLVNHIVGVRRMVRIVHATRLTLGGRRADGGANRHATPPVTMRFLPDKDSRLRLLEASFCSALSRRLASDKATVFFGDPIGSSPPARQGSNNPSALR